MATASGKEDPLVALDRVLNAPTPHQERRKEQYLQRLSSFSTTTYFAKPPSLSPLVCACFGWENKDVDILYCEKCKACISITYFPGLSTFAADKLTCLYEKQLASAHDASCPFQKETRSYFSTEAKAPGLIVPDIFFRYFPGNLIRLVESPRPIVAFSTQVKQRLKESDVSTLKSFQVDRHPSIQQYRPPSKDADVVVVEDYLIDAISQGDSAFDDYEKDHVKKVCALTLLGWYPKESSETNTWVSCQLCLAVLDLVPMGMKDHQSSKNEPPNKRTRISGKDLLSMHRHYCPYVCGFPRQGASYGVPLWKSLADRMLTKVPPAVSQGLTPDGLNKKSEWVKANALFNAGLARTQKPRDSVA